MTKAEQVRQRRLCAKRSVELFYEQTNKTDTRVSKVFELLLDILDKNTSQLVLTDIVLFDVKTIDVKEYSIHEDGLYHYKEEILHFEKKVNVEQFMKELKQYIEQHDGYYAKRLPYQRYYNESLTYYLQIGIQ